ncbi:MAG: hypothetical protein Q7S33_00665 [Nanoarchaeota archaeon]|nr:hypothetical protein [Nanoarchaeota archaeon]
MNLKDIKDEIDKGKVLFGIRQTLKFFEEKKENVKPLKEKTSAKPKSVKSISSKNASVFLARDSREDTRKMLEDKKIEFEVFKTSKEDIAKELGLNFEAEVFLVKK